MVQPQGVQHRGVKVVDGELVLRRVEAVVVRLALAEARSHSPAGEPHGDAGTSAWSIEQPYPGPLKAFNAKAS